MYLFLRGPVLERITERAPGVVAGYRVMTWDGERPDIGQIWNAETGVFEDPPEAVTVEVPTHRTVVLPGEFKRLFTLQERMAIDRARDLTVIDAIADEAQRTTARELKRALDIFFGDLEDPFLPSVDVQHPDVVIGLENVRAAGLIDDHRPAEIQQGWPL
ncbi:hypothetical protein [Roseibium alexandrii]|uniref:hypothetical protein n=1 Tax=Roseibium alexandrii TaxID=388408 RepID=UPI0037506AA2